MTTKEFFSTLWSKIKEICTKFWKQIAISVSAIITILFFKKKLQNKKEIKSLESEIKKETKEIKDLNTSTEKKESDISTTIEEVNSAIEKTNKKKEDIKNFLPDL